MKLEWKEVPLKASSVDEGAGGAFTGTLSTYGNVDRVGDICDIGCFSESLKQTDRYPALWQHEQTEPIGHMVIKDSDEGLKVSGVFNQKVRRGQEAYALLKAGDISGLSIGYTPDEVEFDTQGIRHLKKVTLWEGSIVTFPANIEAMAEAKNMSEDIHTLRQTVGEYLEGLDEEDRADAIEELRAQLEASADGSEDKADEEVPSDEEVTDDEAEDEVEIEDEDEEAAPEEDDVKSIHHEIERQIKKMTGMTGGI